jgi:hypothetical protein
MLEQISGSAAYSFDFKGKSYMITTSWDDMTNYEEFMAFDENDKEVKDLDLLEEIKEAFEDEMHKQEKSIIEGR